jgi:quinol monooxygenase YgiN
VIVVLAEVFAQIPQREAIREAMLAAQQDARAEDGCLSYMFAETLEEPGRFVAVERWRDQAALDAHFRSAGFERYQDAVTPLVTRDSEVHVYSVQEATKPVDDSSLDLRQDD